MSQMTDHRLIEILSAYGASPFRWPEEERAAAEALLEANPERFADALADAQSVDADLGVLPAVDLPEGLISHLIASAPIGDQAHAATKPGPPRWQFRIWASGFATACLALGMALGYALPVDSGIEYDPSEDALTYALFDSDFTSFVNETDG
ncbi:MAG: hypothetical protein AAFY34_08340 [Pseudomonadota bacterium]